MYDLIIVGGGPAATAAAVYARRKLFNVLLLAKDLNGAFFVSNEIRNFIGMPLITGEGLAKMFKNHLKSYEGPGLKVLTGKNIEKISKIESGFEIQTESAESYKSKFVLIASGRSEKKLNVSGADEFEGRGIFYCVECDAPLMADKKVAVVGSGNLGLLAAKSLLPYAEKIYVLEKNAKIKGEAFIKEELEQSGKVLFITNANVLKLDSKELVIAGKKFLQELVYKDSNDKKEKVIEVDGVFVKIGSSANSAMVKDLVKLNERGDIAVDPRSGKTSVSGIWAAGDVADCPYKQINIAIGDAIKAVMNMGEEIK